MIFKKNDKYIDVQISEQESLLLSVEFKKIICKSIIKELYSVKFREYIGSIIVKQYEDAGNEFPSNVVFRELKHNIAVKLINLTNIGGSNIVGVSYSVEKLSGT